ncbi:hypothetical protein RND71_017488 [Anisodus tanguticus]|uniref:Uncharacterized protein n=1 Tax=Anisodus tanguticus TaxID=243964 RepID=A0AAE1S2V4_9SOLA|nr:hypothetical protein RND71_017488 [Anisodus tanguticus]
MYMIVGYVNSSLFVDIMEKNKHQVLPQLRSATSTELGCDARGFSRAGKDTRIWYCVVLVGRYSQELNEMRETMHRVQETLSNDGELTAVDQDPSSAPALLALKQKRLTFTWLDGEAQKTSQLFIVRYERNGTEDVEKQPTNKFSALYNVETDPASQLVAKYNGSNKIEEIVQWISEIIKDGDSKNLPSFKTRTPELVPEDADSSWSSWSEGTVSPSRGLNHRIKKKSSEPDHSSQKSNEPERSNQRTREPDQSNQPNAKEATIRKRRPRNDLVPPSMTDVEPKDAQQVEFSDSDTG